MIVQSACVACKFQVHWCTYQWHQNNTVAAITDRMFVPMFLMISIMSETIVLIAGLLGCVLASRLTEGVLIVSVDPVNGNDSECFSLQEMALFNSTTRFSIVNGTDADTAQLHPCKTLNRALGNLDCKHSCKYQEINTDPLRNVVIRLLDGVHRLSDCIAIDGGQNVTIESVNSGQASVECANNMKQSLDGIRSCRTKGLIFRGVRFEYCRYSSPAVFLNRSSEIVFEDCMFA